MFQFLVTGQYQDPVTPLGAQSNANSRHASPSATRSDADDGCGSMASISQENSPSRYSARAGSCRSACSEATSCASTSSSAVKTRQINHLKLELEMRDHRIVELERGFEDQVRQAECSKGELAAKLEEQQAQLAQLMANFALVQSRCAMLEQHADAERREQAVRDLIAAETAARKNAVLLDEADVFEMLCTEEKMARRRAAIAERARILVEEEEAALMQQALARQRAAAATAAAAAPKPVQQTVSAPPPVVIGGNSRVPQPAAAPIQPQMLQRHQQQAAIVARQQAVQQQQQDNKRCLIA
jgi:hypothetical protein